jgi:hypothetical protein
MRFVPSTRPESMSGFAPGGAPGGAPGHSPVGRHGSRRTLRRALGATLWAALVFLGGQGPAPAGGVPGLPGPAPLAAQDPSSRAVQPVDPAGRDFRHARHAAIPCGECHGLDERHRVRREWSARECSACHHGNATPASCTSCHEAASFTAPLLTTTPMALSVWEGPRTRQLWFEHVRHGEVGCLDCHQGGMSFPPEACSSCHEKHHRPDAECASCHVAPAPEVHGLAAHASCGGSGCHSAAATQRPMLSRPSCLVCHDDKRDHRPGRDCVRCHIMPRSPLHDGAR